MGVKTMVASHKKCEIPKDCLYLPILVGKALNLNKDFGYQGDNSGENISKKNPYYCELTAVYWRWKNLKADYIRLAHYRRYFCYKRKGKDWNSILTSEEAESLCKQYDFDST